MKDWGSWNPPATLVHCPHWDARDKPGWPMAMWATSSQADQQKSTYAPSLLAGWDGTSHWLEVGRHDLAQAYLEGSDSHIALNLLRTPGGQVGWQHHLQVHCVVAWGGKSSGHRTSSSQAAKRPKPVGICRYPPSSLLRQCQVALLVLYIWDGHLLPCSCALEIRPASMTGVVSGVTAPYMTLNNTFLSWCWFGVTSSSLSEGSQNRKSHYSPPFPLASPSSPEHS